MRFTRFAVVSALSLAIGLTAGGVLMSGSFAQDGPAAGGERTRWLSIPQIHDKLITAGYRDIEKIEREAGGYEVRATAPAGGRVKLFVNPQTGELADRPRERQRKAAGERPNSADCSERRCRDERPEGEP